MPELPEVETIVRSLRPILLNRRLARVKLTRSDIVHPDRFNLSRHLTGRTVTDITRRGKRIVFTLDNGNRFYIHLGMTGRLTVEPRQAPIEKHTHMLVDLCDSHGRQLRFRDARRFGGIWWVGDAPDNGAIGPEPLTLRPRQLFKRLLRTKRAIKTALLDQSILAGIGNIYADEALFESKIHPQTCANELTELQVRRLNRALKLTLRRALRHRGSTLRDYVDAQGAAGAFQNQHRVYDRTGHPCPRCHTPITRITLAARSTHFCPQCQPPGPAERRNRPGESATAE